LASADFDSVDTIKLWVVSVVDRARELLHQRGVRALGPASTLTQTPPSSLAVHPQSAQSTLPLRPVPPRTEPPLQQRVALARSSPPPPHFEPSQLNTSEDDAMRMSKCSARCTTQRHASRPNLSFSTPAHSPHL
jgi:hypothetical protein